MTGAGHFTASDQKAVLRYAEFGILRSLPKKLDEKSGQTMKPRGTHVQAATTVIPTTTCHQIFRGRTRCMRFRKKKRKENLTANIEIHSRTEAVSSSLW